MFVFYMNHSVYLCTVKIKTKIFSTFFLRTFPEAYRTLAQGFYSNHKSQNTKNNELCFFFILGWMMVSIITDYFPALSCPTSCLLTFKEQTK